MLGATLTKHTVAHITQLKATLSAVPDPTPESLAVTMRRTIALLDPELQALHAKGYSYAMIAALLNEHGVNIRADTLASYMSALRRKRTGVQPGGRPPFTLPGWPGGDAVAPVRTEVVAQAPKGTRRTALPQQDIARTGAGFVPAPDREDL